MRNGGGRRCKIDTQTRLDPGASVLADGGGPVLSARVAEEGNQISGQELTEGAERTLSDIAKKANVKKVEAWGHFGFCRQNSQAINQRILWIRVGRSPGRKLTA